MRRSGLCAATVVAVGLAAVGARAQAGPIPSASAAGAVPSASATIATPPAPPPVGVEVDGETTKRIDTACNAWDGVPFNLSLRNTGTTALDLDLQVDALQSETKGVLTDAQVKLVPERGKPFPAPFKLELKQTTPITVLVRGALGPGKWSSTLRSHGAALAVLVLEVPGVPLTVKIGGSPPTSESLVVTRDERTTILLENPDPIGHDLTWAFNPGAEGTPVNGSIRLPAGGTSTLNLTPSADWFGPLAPGYFGCEPGSHLCLPRNVASLFKDDERDSFLTISSRSPECPNTSGAPSETFRLKTKFAAYSAERKTFWSYTVLLTLLLIGALFSLYVNYKFPDERIRRDLKAALAKIGSAIANLAKLSSKLRIPVGVELHALRARLRVLRWYSSDFDVNRAGIMAQTGRLQRRVELLDRYWQLRDEHWRWRKQKVPPTLYAKAEDLFQQVERLLNVAQTNDADLQTVDAKLVDVASVLSSWSQPNEQLAAQITALLVDLYNDITAGPLGKSPTFVAAKGQLSLLVSELSKAPPTTPILVPDYYKKDSLTARGGLLRDYSLALDAKLAGAAPSPEQQQLQARLLSLLQVDSWDENNRARLLVSQTVEGVYSSEVQQQLQDKQVEIRVDRSQLNILEPANFQLKFKRDLIDSATACQEWRFRWTFSVKPPAPKQPAPPPPDASAGGQAAGLFVEEDGRSVSHFFSNAGDYTVRVAFRHRDTGDLFDAKNNPVFVERTVSVEDPHAVTGSYRFFRWLFGKPYALIQENLNEVIRLGIALVPAVLGLVSGAKDQLLKMDLFVALIATFLAGFGSDQVKNLLAPKLKSARRRKPAHRSKRRATRSPETRASCRIG